MKENLRENTATPGVSRRKFLTYAGGLAGATLLLNACKKDSDNSPMPEDRVDLGQGDTGVLNYAYVLEQLEAAFYIKVLSQPFTGMSADDKKMLEDLRDHEIAHREYLKTFLAEKAAQSFEFDFGSIDFSSKDSVMNAAKNFEDLGVSAYNGALPLLSTTEYFTIMCKLASVEARHAAAVRNYIAPGSFSDTTDSNGIDSGKAPADVIALVRPYMKVSLSVANFPKN